MRSWAGDAAGFPAIAFGGRLDSGGIVISTMTGNPDWWIDDVIEPASNGNNSKPIEWFLFIPKVLKSFCYAFLSRGFWKTPTLSSRSPSSLRGGESALSSSYPTTLLRVPGSVLDMAISHLGWPLGL